MYRTCLHVKHYTDSECKVFMFPDNSNVTKHIEEEVQAYLAYVSLVREVLESLVPAILSFFLGVWSDTYGRKPLIVWPLLGKFFFFFCSVLSVHLVTAALPCREIKTIFYYW